MNTGQKLSALMHGGLILWVLLFDLFGAPPDRPAPAVTEVALISAADFAALSAPAEPPPPVASPQPPPPEPIAAPEPVVPPPPPEPIAAPQPVAPPPQPVAPPAPDPAPPQAAVVAPVLAPEASIRPQQRSDAQRVAPQDAPEPPPEARIAPQAQPAPAPEPAAAATPAPPAPAPAAPPAAVTETVTEATRIVPDEPARRTATAPEVSLRPLPRPQRAQPQPQPQPQPQVAAAQPPQPAQPARPPQPAQPAAPPRDAVAEALAEALSQGLAGALAPAGPAGALTQSDMDGLRLAVESCWNVGLMSPEAFAAVVTIGFELDRNGRPLPETIRLVEAEGGTAAGQEAAFRAGRAAVIDCGAQGYGLPPDLYDIWRQVEIRFNPSLMGFR